MIGKTVALIKVPNQRLFATKAAARYLGVSPDTLRKYADLGRLDARRLERRRVFTLENLDEFIESLPCYAPESERPGARKEVDHGNKPGRQTR